jgi:hypothetical protein
VEGFQAHYFDILDHQAVCSWPVGHRSSSACDLPTGTEAGIIPSRVATR